MGVESTDPGEGSGQWEGEGDDERADFFPLFKSGFGASCSSASVSGVESVWAVSTLDFLKARTSTPPIDRRFTDVLVGLEVVSTSVRSDSADECPVSSSRTGDEERQVKGEERGEGDRDRDLDRDLVGGVNRFGVRGTDKASPEFTGDGRMSSGTTAAEPPSQLPEMPVWSEDMSASWAFSGLVTGGVGIGETAASKTSSLRRVGGRGPSLASSGKSEMNMS